MRSKDSIMTNREQGRISVRPCREAGWTLLEIMLIVIISGVLVAIAVPGLWSALKRADEGATIQDLRAISSARTGIVKPEATIAELVGRNLLDVTFTASPLDRHGYRFTEPAQGQVAAAPINGIGRHYLLDRDGVIRWRDDAPATSADPSIGSR